MTDVGSHPAKKGLTGETCMRDARCLAFSFPPNTYNRMPAARTPAGGKYAWRNCLRVLVKRPVIG